VVPARARQRGPPADGLDTARGRQRQRIERSAIAILHRPFAAELAVPDRELPIEVPEPGEGDEVDSVGRRRGAHGLEGNDDFLVKLDGRVFELGQMGPCPTGELRQREFRDLQHGRNPTPAELGVFCGFRVPT
jgi:hypothetical protein